MISNAPFPIKAWGGYRFFCSLHTDVFFGVYIELYPPRDTFGLKKYFIAIGPKRLIFNQWGKRFFPPEAESILSLFLREGPGAFFESLVTR